ncbi:MULTISPECIES: glycine cleavage system protein GcvH [Desulfovibrio]|uniref:Glycine cleavage system H protein n=2 Tax=root TaxID=1 RepID=A0A212J1J0_9BACT|nr:MULTISPECIES: glycine cleavage system protein GcvH [Desulfovibrio]MBD8894601.1 glycine cleavage system protein GcvH [Desulfovibrio desulfuricans]MBT9749075.1 glycine cleavage system protein GcvH [Desulfovibrio desulfuricans]MCB6540797.1 glycine cleavage system protein GcvH [Desulfovibrio desulfuricans]MCB6551879.1 glycine cleavage system protein GcvH [Desulfovibrio desulfuricans]MCB6563721.1 glycine cleavage system protein GcvH [Desulfovibrio desulfuricans]
MKDLDQLALPENLRYTDEHVWLCVEGETATVGISDFAQDQLGEIAFVDLPAVGTTYKNGQEFGTVESLKSVNALFMPVAGSVLEVNETLESTPTLVNAKPYNEGWMLRIRMDDPAEAATLADSAAYLNLLRKG